MSGVTDSSLVDLSNCKLQKLNDLLTKLKEEKRKYIKSEIFKDVILETTGDKSNGMNSMLAVKIRDVILRGELINNLKIKDADELTLLDTEEFMNIELTYDEQKQLKMVIEQKLKEKKDLILKDVNDISDCDIKTIQDIIENIKDPSNQKDVILEQEKNIRELHESHIKAITKLGDLLLKLLSLRTELGPKTMENKAQQLYYESEKIKLRTRIIELKGQVSIFKSSPMSLEAYQIAYKDLKEKQKNYIKEIEDLRSDIEKYNILTKNEEYLVILKDYKQYLKSLENKKWLHSETL